MAIEQLRFRGANLQMLRCRDHAVILCSPSDTGKTYATCFKAAVLAMTFPNCHGALVRKTYASINESVGKTFGRVTAGLPVRKYGGASAGIWKFDNGSTIVPIGMDSPDKLLSSEWDFVQICQAEELKESDWEIISSRCTGRGSVVNYPQVFADCNPGGSKHWIRERAKSGRLTLISGTHKDNPELYDDAGKITEVGIQRIKHLEDTLTGMRRKRLLEGIWATAEGAVYDTFDPAIHVTTRDAGEMKQWFLSVDEGYTNPAAILLVGADADGRWHVFREYYERNKLQAAVVDQARDWFLRPVHDNPQIRCTLCVVDEAAAGLIADMQSAGIYAKGAKGRVLDGINAIQNRLAVQKDGRTRLTMDPGCANLINEFESYVWAPDKPKDTPIKEWDHALDSLKYLAIALGEGTGAWNIEAVKEVNSAAAQPIPDDYGQTGEHELETSTAFDVSLEIP